MSAELTVDAATEALVRFGAALHEHQEAASWRDELRAHESSNTEVILAELRVLATRTELHSALDALVDTAGTRTWALARDESRVYGLHMSHK